MLKRLFASKEKPFFPGYDEKDKISVNLCSASFGIELPANCSELDGRSNGSSVNIYDSEIYSDFIPKEEYRQGRFSHAMVFQRHWSLWGGIREWDEPLADLSCTAIVKKVEGLSVVPTCFNPIHFEQIILRDLYFSYGPGMGRSEYIAPGNWDLRDINGVGWVYCEARPSEKYAKQDPHSQSNFTSEFYAPIDDGYFIQLSFSVTGFLPKELSNKIMLNYIKQLSQSMMLKLTPSAQERERAAISDTNGATISPSREPQPWIYHQFRNGDQSKGEPVHCLVEHGSLPPDITE